jgi:putative transposase
MARPIRQAFPGVALHIIQRGHNRNACFRQESDYLVYLAHLRVLSIKYECQLHAFCMMTNHIHLLITPSTADGCTALMRDLGRRYVQYFNRRYGRTGTLWEGRFRSCVVESGHYVLGCYRYIELNPVRAGMVDSPAAYLWSSHAVNGGMRVDPAICPHPEYLALADAPETRHAVYRRLFGQGLEPELQRTIRDAMNGGYPLASEAFKASVIGPAGGRLMPGKRGPRAKSHRLAQPPGHYLVF